MSVPFRELMLPVGDGHCLRGLLAGDPAGEPLALLHGGPGSGTSPRLLDLCDPARQWIVAFDQRGAGLSTPRGKTTANTTAHLVADLETVRRHLGITRWRVAGGSWGATLALAYAIAHREAVSGLVLRSPFLPGRGNVDHFFRNAADGLPAARAALHAAVPEARGDDLLAALAARLAGADGVAEEAALAWLAYERAVAGEAGPPPALDGARRRALVDKYRIQAHYLLAGCFMDEAAFLDGCATLAGLPVSLLHGVDDRVCPPANARRLHARIAGSRLEWIAGCGHDPFHPAMAAAWRAALAQPV